MRIYSSRHRLLLRSRIRLCFAVVVKLTDYYHWGKDSRWLRSITIRIAGHVYMLQNSTQRIRDF